MKTEKDRTGIGTYRQFQHAEDPPGGLNAILIRSWFYSDVATARVDHFNYVLRLWRSLPDTNIVEITEEQRRHMLQEANRTGIGAVALMRRSRPSETGGFQGHIVQLWMSGPRNQLSVPSLNSLWSVGQVCLIMKMFGWSSRSRTTKNSEVLTEFAGGPFRPKRAAAISPIWR